MPMEKSLKINYSQFHDWKSLNKEDQKLVLQAYEICDSAWAPYSKFLVGAVILLKNGTVISGSNQENIAFPSGLCAERVALFYAGANYKGEEIDTLAIVAKGNLVPKNQELSPCGACRQVMLESENRQKNPFRVILVNQNGSVNIFSSARDLLPLAFGIQ